MIDVALVTMAHRLFLGREPEGTETITALAQEPDLEHLVARLVRSYEFRRRAAHGIPQTGEEIWVQTEIRNRLKLQVDLLDTGVGAGVLQDNWEPNETDFILSVLRPSDTFIDIGANIGWFTILGAHRVGSLGRVYAFEPRKDLHEHLLRSIEANGFEERCSVHAVALGATDGEMTLAAFPSELNPGHTFMSPGCLPEGAVSLGRVPVLALDSVTIRERVRLIKIDVEGAEALVLRGAKKLLQRDHPIIVAEVFPKWLQAVSGVRPRDYLMMLQDYGYRVFGLGAAGLEREIHSFPLQGDIAAKEYFSIVALAEDDAAKVLLPGLDGRLAHMEQSFAQDRLEMQLSLARERAEMEQSLARERAEMEQSLANHRHEIEESRAKDREIIGQSFASHLAGLEQVLVQTHTELEHARDYSTELEAQLDHIRRESECEGLLWQGAVRQAIENADSELARQTTQHSAEVSSVNAQLAALENSTLWRATGPLRRLSSRLPVRLRRNLARGGRLAWWSASLQLHSRLGERRRRLSLGTANLTEQPTLIPAVMPPSLRSAERPVALIIDEHIPTPDRDSGSIDAVNLIDGLVTLGFHVIYAALSDFWLQGARRDEVLTRGARCLGPDDAPSVDKFIIDHGDSLSLCVLSRISAGGRYCDLVRRFAPHSKVIFNPVDLHFLREERQARLRNNSAELVGSVRTRISEEFLVSHSDATIVVSDAECKILKSLIPSAKVFQLSLARPIIQSSCGFSERTGIGFIGGFEHTPNVDALRYFVADIWPNVLMAMPDSRLEIVGRSLPPDTIENAPGDIRYHGHLPNTASWFGSIRVSIAPLRYGAGAKGKVASSLAAGVPCVGTRIATEGMGLSHGQNIMVADGPKAFAEAICRVYTDADLWSHIATNGLTYAEHTLSIAAFRRNLHSLLLKIGLPVLAPT